MNKWIGWFDGAMPPSGPCFGALLSCSKTDVPVSKAHGPVDFLNEERTTNVAEYGGLVAVLQLAEANVPNGDIVEIRGDSQLVIRQMNGQYKVRKPHLLPYVERAKKIIERMRSRGISVILNWIPREENTQADELSKTEAK